MENIEKLERRLWEAADQLRANSKLTSSEYFMPVLGLIFLRHAHNRFLSVAEEIKKNLPVRFGETREIESNDFRGKSAIYLPEKARYDYLVTTTNDKAEAVIEAMTLIENESAALLSGVLPKDYRIFEPDVLARLIKIFNDEALQTASGDVFGRIYEYFLMKFAIQGAQDSGEFFTPVSLVQTIVNVIEPTRGKILDPACGSGGMFAQTSHFLEEIGKEAQTSVTFYGQEKTATTIRLAKMNLAVHGLEGNIVEANTFYEDKHELRGGADYVMANPPFNVDKVDADKVKNDARLPFGLPGVNKENSVSNGNYLWIQYFYSYLNERGRAGFVMSSQASSAGNKEKDVRESLVKTGAVDVMISIRSNFFYTRSVPCELWFFDKGKPETMRDKVLMLDARNIYRKVTRKIFDFTDEQLNNIRAIVWLYRGESERYLRLVESYFAATIKECGAVLIKIEIFEKSLRELRGKLKDFSIHAEKSAAKSGETAVEATTANAPLLSAEIRLQTVLPEAANGKANGAGEVGIDAAKFAQWRETIKELNEAFDLYEADRERLAVELEVFSRKYGSQLPDANEAQNAARVEFEAIAERAKGLTKQIDLLYKLAARAAETAEKDLAAKELAAKNLEIWDYRAINRLRKELETGRKEAVEQLKQTVYFYKQIVWLETRFPDARFVDVEGLVKLVSLEEIAANDWSLTPGRYVGVAPPETDDDFDFEETLGGIHLELAGLNDEAFVLAQTIQQNFSELGI